MDYYRFTIKIPKQPWQWLRFRLVTILLLITIAALVLGWRKDHLQQQATIYRLQNPGPRWDTDQVTGPPDTDRYGDCRTAWASKSADDQPEWLVLEYEKPVDATAVKIYETYNPGAVCKVTHYPQAGNESVLWEGNDPTPSSVDGGISLISIRPTQPIRRIKIYLDSPAVRGWNEIDAVGLVASDKIVHWAANAWASSSYGRNNALPSWQISGYVW